MLKNRAFTLIELLVVIAIIAILAAVVFVALDPGRRFAEARDSARWTDVTSFLSAIKLHQVDSGGQLHPNIQAMTNDTNYMIVSGAVICTAVGGLSCSAVTVADGNCVDLSDLVTSGYLGRIPLDPAGAPAANMTGYYLSKSAQAIVTVGACEAERVSAITVQR